MWRAFERNVGALKVAGVGNVGPALQEAFCISSNVSLCAMMVPLIFLPVVLCPGEMKAPLCSDKTFTPIFLEAVLIAIKK